MQVTQVDAHVTHAVIGGQKAMAFGISDDPEFFVMLSNTLYSQKKLAVVREVLCNGWDAHILAGCTDKPLQITLSDSQMVIRDFGPGIAHELMQQIYCVYGKSNKKHDGKQTGGFGLGCKAPWAYVDHFEVTVWHGGKKTIYRASKSSAEADGKPALIPLVSIPCGEETGLQVSLEVRGRQDMIEFRSLIQSIAANGEMNAELNGIKLKTLPFSQAKQGFLITQEALNSSNPYHKIWVRYGNVIYPVEINPAYQTFYSEASKLLDLLKDNDNYNTNPRKLVLQAEPNSISVTPSRESLSLTDFTLETLKGLLDRFVKLRDEELVKRTWETAQRRVKLAIDLMQPHQLLSTELVLPLGRYWSQSGRAAPDHLTDFEHIAQVYARKHYPNFANFRRNDLTLRLRTLIEFGYGGQRNLGKLQSFLSEYLKENKAKPGDGHQRSNWLQQRIIAPLLTGLKAEEQLAPERLWVFGSSNLDRRRNRYDAIEVEFTEASKVRRDKLEECLPFLRNLVILTHNRIDVVERARLFPAMRNWFGQTTESLVYVVQRSDQKIKAARAFFRQQGLVVIDLTARQTWEPMSIGELKQKKEYKKRKTGLPTLRCLTSNGAWDPTAHRNDGVELIETPEFVVQALSKGGNGFGYFSHDISHSIIRLFGDKGGIVVNKAQLEKYRLTGAKELIEYLVPKVAGEIRTNPRIQQYLSVDPKQSSDLVKPMSDHKKKFLLNVILPDEVLRTYFNVGHEMTEADFEYLAIWRSIEEHSRYCGDGQIQKEVSDFCKYLKTIKLSDEMINLQNAIADSQLLLMIDRNEAEGLLRNRKTDNERTQQRKAKVRDILIHALKG